jgi:hypothetical protein
MVGHCNDLHGANKYRKLTKDFFSASFLLPDSKGHVPKGGCFSVSHFGSQKFSLSLLTLPAEKEEQSLLENRPNMTMKQELEIILTS